MSVSDDSTQKEEMVMGIEAFDCGIQKRLVHAGKSPIQYIDGTKVYFHYRTIVAETGAILDDSKLLNEKKPMELIIGKKFKLEAWEKSLKTMWLNEVARFSVVKELLFDYPIVAKQLREYYASMPSGKCCSGDGGEDEHDHEHHKNHKKSAAAAAAPRQHCCGFNLLEQGVGYADLDELLKNPKQLDFVFELIGVEQPGEYKKDSWILNDAERLEMIPKLKQEGNDLYKKKQFNVAIRKYEEALSFLEQFMLREKPNDIEWNEFNEQKMIILLNFSLCKFNLNDFYSCIEHTSTIIEHQPTNVKALYRRGKAHMAVWNVNEARQDFEKCRQLDSSLSKDIDMQLNHLNQLVMKKEKEQMEKFKGKLFS